jgi:hypothetical protein
MQLVYSAKMTFLGLLRRSTSYWTLLDLAPSHIDLSNDRQNIGQDIIRHSNLTITITITMSKFTILMPVPMRKFVDDCTLIRDGQDHFICEPV